MVDFINNWARKKTNTSSEVKVSVLNFEDLDIKSINKSDLICLWRNGRDKWVTLDELTRLDCPRVVGVLVWKKLIQSDELHQQITVYSKI